MHDFLLYASGSYSEHHMSMQQLIQRKIRHIVCRLENNVCRLYDPFQDILGELRLLFHEEEVLMIRTRYPDYKSQQIAHSCFLKRMYLQQTASGNDFGQDAVQWLTRHETISDALFRIYLEKKIIRAAENIIFDLHAPDHVITSEDGHF